MKFYLIFIVLLFCIHTNANSTSNDFGSHSGEVKNLTEKDLREQLVIEGNIFVLDSSGSKLLFEAREERQWKFSRNGDLISHWSYKADRVLPVALRHHWTIDKNGQINVHIKQYSSMEADLNGKAPKLGRLVKEKKFIVHNFEPISWKVRSNKKKTVIARLTPRLGRKNKPQQVGDIPISGKNLMAADSKGFVWAPDATFSGQYVTLKTNRGTVHLSYQPFKGAKEIGVAKNNKIKIDLGKKHKLTLLNSAPLLPHGMEAKVFGMIDLQSKSRPGSTHIVSSDQERDFLSSFQ